MKTWLIVDQTSLLSIQAINENNLDKKASPTTLTDGRMILPVAMLTDSYWSNYYSIFSVLQQSTFDPSSLLPKVTL